MRLTKFLKSDRFYLTDGGLETFMVFDKGYDLPCFSAAVLLETEGGRAELSAYFDRFIGLAKADERGYVLDVPTWRSGMAWAEALGKSALEQMQVNTEAVRFVEAIRAQQETEACPILLNGLVGPAGDAYAPGTLLSESEALDTHAPQIAALAGAGVDLISALTLTHSEEAVGIVRAAQKANVPLAIAFTLETDGNLPSGQPLGEAIAQVDSATANGPIYYMINCAHPDHFRDKLSGNADWLARIGGLRCNASRLSHAELDAAEELDDGDPQELGRLNADLLEMLPNVRVFGGCCGTDHRHVECMSHHASDRRAA